MSEVSEVAIYRRLFDEKYAEIDELLTGLTAEGLLWKPFSISPWHGPAAGTGWLVAHAISSTVYLLKRAEWTIGRIPWAEVDGDEGAEEFGPASHDPVYLSARARRTQEYVHRLLATVTADDLARQRPHPEQPSRLLSPRYDIVHALEHMSQHIGHAQLTRQLWAVEQGSREPGTGNRG